MCEIRPVRTMAIYALMLIPLQLAADDLVIVQSRALVQDVAGNLIVQNGATVNARNVHISGDVLVEAGASFYGQGVQIDGMLTGQQAGNVTLKKSAIQPSRVSGDVHICNSSGAIRIFDSNVSGYCLIEDNVALDIVIRNSVVARDVQLFHNRVQSGIVLRNNLILGNIQTAFNEPEPVDVGNVVSGPRAIGSFIEVMAEGDEGDEWLQLQIDQRPVRQWTATGSMRPWCFRATETIAAERIRIAFINDILGPGAIDRNLRVDSISIDGVVFETEDPSVYSTGSLNSGQSVGPGFHQSESLHVNGYFQFGLTGIDDQLMHFALNDVLQDGWTHALTNDGTDVRLRTFEPGGRPAFQARFGAAGVISSVQDSRNAKHLLARSYRGEVTDRVIQWTIWEQGQSVVHDVSTLPSWEDRFNVAQAGTYLNVLHGTVAVVLSAEQGQLDVWSEADRLWKAELDPFVQGSITALTRTKVLDGGALLVRRVIRVGKIALRGAEVTLGNPLFEAWNPFSDSAFNSMALGIDDQGRPNRWFANSKDIPHYPAWPVFETRGWAMAYNRYNLGGGATMTVVYGRDPGRVHLSNGTTTDPQRFVFNSMDFSGGFAILPALWTKALPKGSIIDQFYILVPTHGIQANTAATLDALSERLPSPRVYHPGSALRGELSVIVDRLAELSNEPLTYTDHLGTVN